MVTKAIPTDIALRLDNQLCFAMYSTSQAITQVYKPLLNALNLTYPQYLVMLLLWEQDGQAVSDLGERLYLDSGTLTPLLKRMEGKGMLRRQRSLQDERRVEIYLTPAGSKLKTRAATIPGCVMQAADCSLSDMVALTQKLKALRHKWQA